MLQCHIARLYSPLRVGNLKIGEKFGQREIFLQMWQINETNLRKISQNINKGKVFKNVEKFETAKNKKIWKKFKELLREI